MTNAKIDKAMSDLRDLITEEGGYCLLAHVERVDDEDGNATGIAITQVCNMSDWLFSQTMNGMAEEFNKSGGLVEETKQ